MNASANLKGGFVTMAETPAGAARSIKKSIGGFDSGVGAFVSDEIERKDRAPCGVQFANDGAPTGARLPEQPVVAVELAGAQQRADSNGGGLVKIIRPAAESSTRRRPPAGGRNLKVLL